MGRLWGRLYSHTRNHRKIVALSRRHPTHWRVVYTLLEMSFETWDGGRILAAPGIPYTLAELSEEVRLSPKKLLPILQTMDKLCLVKLETECANSDLQNAKKMTIFLHFESWNRRQFESDLSTNRTQKLRAKAKESNTYDTSGTVGERPPERPGNGDGNAPDTYTETYINPPTPLKGEDIGAGGKGKEPKVPKTRKTKADRKLAPYSEEFEKFWEIYPNKLGGKEEAWGIWLRRMKAETLPPLDDLMDCLDKLVRDYEWMREDGKFVPMITTFLNNGRWTDVAALKSASKCPASAQADPNCPHCKGRGLEDAEQNGVKGQSICRCRRKEG